ncbi:unnamed protein product [Mesocestoides corti]|uniref:Kinesin-like domain-containing protein n=1 Tax=Mesocestoides corti TaxID=53468 RepID=A0A3P6GFJ4_MESCO|nr:unnamed protein product [Mesocestoides corti]
MRQGLNRRVRVLIRPSELNRRERGCLPLVCEAVTKISVGCVTRLYADLEDGVSSYNKSRVAPDSYQELDLETLRHKWCHAMDEWQSYLQKNLQALARKQEKDSSDEANEGYLLNRWVSSIQERDAILVPAPGSSLPGAPATDTPPPGMEQHNPLIFADLDDAPGKTPMKVGAQSYLDDEEASLKEGAGFVTLPLIKKYATLIGAVASWDSNLHERDFLNKITPASERIYLTVKEEMLWTGVAYQFVAGIPKMTPHVVHGLAANSTSKECEGDWLIRPKLYIEQYMRTIQSVSSELHLDGLRQEVALQEALATNQHRRQPFDLGDLTSALQESTFSHSEIVQLPLNGTGSSPEKASTPTPSSPVFFERPCESVGFKNPASDEAEIRRLMEGFRTSSTSSGRGVGAARCPTTSEEHMAWTRRDREKQQIPK